MNEPVPAVSTNPPLLALDGVSFSYNGTRVLEDVYVTVEGKPFLCIIGPNGGGKTTLLKLIAGLIEPGAGAVRVFGEAPARVRHRIGYLPQYAQIDPKFPVSVLDVVLMGRAERHWGGWYRRADRDAAREALVEVDLADLAHRPFAALSGGQRQRVLIARALACQPDLLLLDEPTANIDALSESRLVEFLLDINRRMAIFMVSHDLGFVAGAVKQVVCVNRRAVMHNTSDISGQTIHDLYGADVRMVRHDTHSGPEGHKHA